MPIARSKLREDIYKLLNNALETGEILEIECKGQITRVVPPQKPVSSIN
jgi:hypothetical protein